MNESRENNKSSGGIRRPVDRRAAASGDRQASGLSSGSASSEQTAADKVRPRVKESQAESAGSAAGSVTKSGMAGKARKGKTNGNPERKKRIPFLPRFRWMLLTVILLAAVGAIGLSYIFSKIELPPDVDIPPQTSFIYDSKGSELVQLHGEQNRTIISLDQMSEPLKQAVLATEDRTFFDHKGVDFKAWIRAGWEAVTSGDPARGTSTLTQQYVKLVYTGGERTYTRKIKEAVMAVKLEQRHSKHEIFTLYLNKVYFGRGAYGVQAASKAYFGKNAKDLGPGEASLLASLLRSPETADPLRSPERAKVRRDASLESMFEIGALTRESADAHKRLDMVECESSTSAPRPGVTCVLPQRQEVIAAAGVNAYFVDYVRQYLIEKYGAERVFKGGLKVYTTIDPRLQSAARSAIDSTLGAPGDPEVAIVTLDSDGRILAMIGGRDYRASQVNLAVGEEGGGSGRQPGSSFKPFTLASAVHSGISLKSKFAGPGKMKLKLPGGGTWEVKNYGGQSFGTVDLMAATANSVNTVYAQLELEDGVDKTVKMAKELGIRSDIKEVPSIVLGSQEVSVLDMTVAYLTFANRGKRTDAIAVTKVVDSSGKILEESSQGERRKVLEENEADQLNMALQGVVTNGTGKGAAIGRPVAGKTGTAEEYGDAWFVGYTPEQLSTAVWVGYAEGSQKKMTNVHGKQVSGGTFPASIWSKYMKDAVKDRPVTKFKEAKLTGKIIGTTDDPCGSPSPGASPAPAPVDCPTPVPSESQSPSPSPTGPRPPSPSPSPSPSGSPSPAVSPRLVRARIRHDNIPDKEEAR